MPRQWYDEYAFIPHNGIIYSSATPAYKTAAMNAARNGAPYGIIITTTPGDLTTDEGLEAFNTKEMATPFNEAYYDFSMQQLEELKASNTNSSFFYIRYTYQQLGSGEDYFKSMVIDLKKEWSVIRREVLLEWAKVSDNSPFRKEDLNVVKNFIREPIQQIMLCNYFTFNIYEKIDSRFPPLVGVDVSGGYQKDSSAITVVDSKTTRVTADLNCNYISPLDLAKVIYELVTKYMPNAVVNVERNGGFGASVLSKLVTTSIKRNLFYEIKDRVIEERFNGMNTIRKTQKTKVYGLDETKTTRDLLMQILRQRMDYHKDKFVSPILFSELETLEVKKNGRIEHTSTGHDDTCFAYLLALYIWYEGKDVMERYGIQKDTLKSDQDLEEAVLGIEEKYENIIEEIEVTDDEQVEKQLEYIKSDKSILYEDWQTQERIKEEQASQELLASRATKQAYCDTYHVDAADVQSNIYTIPTSVFDDFYGDENAMEKQIEENFNLKYKDLDIR